eukprot:GFUD01020466.1.p1 GENE.GFUD01020466.1~~GFUD01020466.1.p1  ORF type:complete len:341 (-),score=118.29 GFUD01020466.1:13-1035(-)
MIEKLLPVAGDDLGMRSCKCEQMARKERRQCREIVMAVVARLGLEEGEQDQTKKEGDACIAKIVQKLLHLQSSLRKEQARVESLLSSKDLLISQLQVQVGQLYKENQRLALLAGVKRKLAAAEERLEDSPSKVSKVVLKSRSQLSSDSGCENLTSDNTSLSDESNDVTPDILPAPGLPPAVQTSLPDSPDLVTTHTSPPSPPVPVPDPVNGLAGPKPPIASRDAVNAKLHLVPPHRTDYILVTRNVSDTNQKTGLYVLDHLPASGDCDQPGDIRDTPVTTDTTAPATKHAPADTATVTPVHAMTNHRTGLKPSDIKYRAKIKAENMTEKTTVSYWTDTFL